MSHINSNKSGQIFLALLLWLVISTNPSFAAGGGSIRGNVTDGSALPLSGVLVTVRNYAGGFSTTTTTDISGNYAATSLASDLYYVQFSKTGLMTGWNGNSTSQQTALPIFLTTPDLITGINATLHQGASISGTVVDANNQPFPNVFVRIYNFIGASIAYTTTDALGKYSVSDLVSGNYYIAFSAPAYQTIWLGGALSRQASTAVNVIAPSSSTGNNRQLGVGGSISGTITDLASVPKANVAVSLYGASGSSFDGGLEATTDSSGLFKFNGLANGTYYIQIAYTSWYGGTTRQTATPITIASPTDLISGINILLDIGSGSIRGTVTDVNDVPLANASLALYNSTGAPVFGGNSSTDSSGNYAFAGLKSGAYFVKCFSMGSPETWYGGTTSQLSATAVTVTSPGITTGKNITIGVGSSISGTVIDAAGNPIQGVNVNLYDSVGNGLAGGSTTTDANGFYILRGFPDGTYYIQFQPRTFDGMPVWYDGKLTKQAATPITISGQNTITGINGQVGIGASISGTVTGPANVPLYDVTVNVYDSAGNFFVNMSTDSSGNYQFRGLPAGMYFIQFNKSGMPLVWYGGSVSQMTATPIIVTSSSVVTGINVTMITGETIVTRGTISGTITDPSGFPMQSARVSLYNTKGESVGNSYGDASGNYLFSSILDGTYYLQFSTTGLQPVWYGGVKSMPASTPVIISGGSHLAAINGQLGIGGSISGIVTNSSLFTQVNLYNGAGKQVAFTRVDPFGYYEFKGLESGIYYVQVTQYFRYGALWYGGQTWNTATPIAVTALEAITNIDLTYGATNMSWIDCEVYGTGGGTIASSPGGISCSKDTTSDCSTPFANTEKVTLTAVPDTTSVFAGWGGDCTGYSTCTLNTAVPCQRCLSQGIAGFN